MLRRADDPARRTQPAPDSRGTRAGTLNEIELLGAKTARLTLYVVPRGNGTSRIVLRSAQTGEKVSEKDITTGPQSRGVYLSWDISGRITVEVQPVAGKSNTVIHGIFIDP